MHVALPSARQGAGEMRHWDLVQSLWETVEHLRRVGKTIIDGQSLDVAAVVAVSRWVYQLPCWQLTMLITHNKI